MADTDAKPSDPELGTNAKNKPSVDNQAHISGHRYRNAAITCAAAAIALMGFVGWLAYQGIQVKSDLGRASECADASADSLLSGDTESALRAARDADRYANRARELTRADSWGIAAAVPVLGSPLATTRQLSDVVGGLISRVLTPAVDAGSALSPDTFIGHGGRVDPVALREAAPVLDVVAAAATELSAQAQEVNGTYLGPVDEARRQLQDKTAQLSFLLDNTATAARVAPAMLGIDGPRNYFVAFQTNAEARGTGGLLGGFGVVSAVDGAIRVDDLSSNRELSGEYRAIDLGPDYSALYGGNRPTTFFGNGNLSSHFPYAAQIWRSHWEQESGERVDGVIATDPVALSYLLAVIGPVRMPDGETVTEHNVVELTESTAYIRFADDNTARRHYLQEIGKQVAERITGRISNPRALLAALGRAANEGRLSLWSAHPDEQAVLSETALGHTVPDDPAPYAGVVINNLGGNKLDYYLEREISYRADECDADTRTSTVTVRLTNAVPDGDLPRYVAGNFANRLSVPYGTNMTDLSLLTTRGTTLVRATVDGSPPLVFTGSELGHPVFAVQFPIPPGKTVDVEFVLQEPTAAGTARVPVQPLVDQPKVTVDVPPCAPR